jgi:CheY-like chemotaxis protein
MVWAAKVENNVTKEYRAMQYENSAYFDLAALLKQDGLNIRQFADKYVTSAAEYFLLLSKFIDLAPEATRALNSFAKRDGDKEAAKSLDGMAALLKDMECDTFISLFYSILDAYEKGNWRLAALHANRITEDFKAFYLWIMSAKRAAWPEEAQNGQLPLKEFIGLLDAQAASRKLVILAVDDSPVILRSVSAVLGDTYKVFALPKPAELEKVLLKLTPDLFLLDYLMPEINGFELIPIIRSLEEHKDTPIIFLTSEGTVDTLTAALGLGACDFVVKPFIPEILREKIAKHIFRKKQY